MGKKGDIDREHYNCMVAAGPQFGASKVGISVCIKFDTVAPTLQIFGSVQEKKPLPENTWQCTKSSPKVDQK
jgi:hypothetical protein